MKKFTTLFPVLLLMFSISLVAEAAALVIDFSELKMGANEQPTYRSVDAVTILEDMGTSAAYIESITDYSNLQIINPSVNKNALYFNAHTNADGEWEPAYATFNVRPSETVRCTRIGIFTYGAENLSAGEKYYVDLSINGGEAEKIEFTKSTAVTSKFIDLNEPTIIKSIRLNVGEAQYKHTDNIVGIQKISLVYDDAAKTSVTTWAFDEEEYSAVPGEEFVMPVLNAVPVEAAAMAEWSSSDPEVAYFDSEGKLTVANEGDTRITAAIPADSKIFTAIEASFLLKAKADTGVPTGSLMINDDNIPTSGILYDLSGREVSGIPANGLYIYKQGNIVKKILVK